MALTRRAIRSAAGAGSSHSGLDDDEVVFGEPVLIWVERRRGGTGHALPEHLGRFAFEFGIVQSSGGEQHEILPGTGERYFRLAAGHSGVVTRSEHPAIVRRGVDSCSDSTAGVDLVDPSH
jgi:hypothetical protein